MSHKAAVHAFYAAFARGDVEFILDRLADAVEWTSNCDPISFPWGGTHEGRKGALAFFRALGESLDFKVFEPIEFAADGDLVFVRGHTVATVKATGKTFESDWVHLFVFADHQVIRFQEFYDTAAIVAASHGD